MACAQPAPTGDERRYGRLAPFVSLAWTLANKQAFDQEDCFQEALFALHAALLKTPKPENPFAFARTVIQRAILNHATKPSVRRFETADKFGQEHVSWCYQEHSFMEGEFLRFLEKKHGPQARAIAEALLGTQQDRRAGDDRSGKDRRHLGGRITDRRHGERRCGERRTNSIRRVRMKSGLSEWRFQKILDRIRSFTREWCIAHDDWYL